jgi:hypothetical protein
VALGIAMMSGHQENLDRAAQVLEQAEQSVREARSRHLLTLRAAQDAEALAVRQVEEQARQDRERTRQVEEQARQDRERQEQAQQAQNRLLWQLTRSQLAAEEQALERRQSGNEQAAEGSLYPERPQGL